MQTVLSEIWVFYKMEKVKINNNLFGMFCDVMN